MSRATAAEPSSTRPWSLGASALPWLLSSTLHTLAFVLLALSWRSTGGAPGASGISLEAALFSSMGQQETGLPVHFDAPPADGFYEDDQSPLLTGRSDPASQSSGSAALSSLLNEEPAVSLAGVLPASGAELGTGGSDSGVDSANNLSNQPSRPKRLRGGSARTGVFGVEGEGNKFVYVFDRSGSMDGHGGAPLIAAKSELIASLADLGQTHQFQIIFYNEQPRIFNPAGRAGRLVFGNEQNKNLARRFVGSITASGATRHLEALEMAVRLGPDVIFFLTDADEPRMTPQELAHIAQMNQGTSINAIEFGYGAQRNTDSFLVTLARQNGGQHVYIDVSQLGPPRR
ncbi:MAG: hypothetical protein WD063_11735 [Pirellulales bacterium]